MASEPRPGTVRWAALAALASVTGSGVGVLVWRDDLGWASTRPLWDRATEDARVLLPLDGALVVVAGGIVSMVVVALVAWGRERTRADRHAALSAETAASDAARWSVRDLVDAWRGSGSLGLLFAAVAASGATFTVFGTIDSIWGAPSLPLSLVSFGGAAVVAAAAAGPVIAGDTGTTDGRRRGLRHACIVLAATLALHGLVVPLVGGSGQLSLTQAVRLLADDGHYEQSTPSVRRYYTELYGPALSAVDGDLVNTEEFGLVIVVVRDGGFGPEDEDDLARAAETLGLPSTAAVVHRGVAVVVVGTIGLESNDGRDHRARIRDLLDG